MIVTFFPLFNLTEDVDGVNPNGARNEFIFIFDRSGSMTGEDRIGVLKVVLKNLLTKMPNTAYFNVINFND